MRHIILGLTGSVATTLAPKMVRALQEKYKVSVVMTKPALYFVKPDELRTLGVPVYTDEDEWPADRYTKDDQVLHVELRKTASALLVAPLSANTLAKFANGLCDNLLTCLYRAWECWTRPVVVAPAMNTLMWQHPLTSRHLSQLCPTSSVVNPVSKVLACKDEGEGALAPINEIIYSLDERLKWQSPLETFSGVPVKNHPGAFGFKRKHSHHTGVDLYTVPGASVHAVESGKVVRVEAFTGPQDNSPWWNDTDALLVEGPTGVICYGEIEVREAARRKDQVVQVGDLIGRVKRVLREGKERPDIPGHSTSMLHLELYPHGTKECAKSWKLDKGKPDDLYDPTPYLLEIEDFKRLEMP